MMDRSELTLSIYNTSGDGLDIHRFPTKSKQKSQKWKKHMPFVHFL